MNALMTLVRMTLATVVMMMTAVGARDMMIVAEITIVTGTVLVTMIVVTMEEVRIMIVVDTVAAGIMNGDTMTGGDIEPSRCKGLMTNLDDIILDFWYL